MGMLGDWVSLTWQANEMLYLEEKEQILYFSSLKVAV